MGLIEGSKVEDSIDSSVDRVIERKDDVDVKELRNPQELINQVDRLEDAVEELKNRQEEILGEDIEISDKPQHSQETNSDVERRLELLEVAVDRLESGFELDAEELRKNIVEEAIEVEDRELRNIKERLDKLEENKDPKPENDTDSRIEELEEEVRELKAENNGVDRQKFEDLRSNVEEMSELLAEIADRV
jgi:DNA repair exonuclease SbcCD ATPase subunit